MSEEKWFKHDSNAKDDPKIVFLIDQLGLEGYGIFWVLIETLREQKDFSYPIKLVPSIARKYLTSPEKIITVIKNYRLFDLYEKEDGDYFFSLSLNQRMHKYAEISEKRKIAGQKGGMKSGNLKQLLSKPEAIAKQAGSNCLANRIEENRIEKKRIEENINDISIEKFDFEKLKNSNFVFSIYTFLNSLKLNVNPEQVTELIDAYIIAMISDGDIYRNENDYRSHLRNWIKIQVEKQRVGSSGLNKRVPLFDS